MESPDEKNRPEKFNSINTPESPCDNCEPASGFYLGMTCPQCNRPFRSVKETQGVVKRLALKWWKSLSKNQQRDYELKTYGDGEEFEDNTLTEGDYIHMYKKWVMRVD